MAEGLKFTNVQLAVPLNVKDYMDLMDVATKKVQNRVKLAVADLAAKSGEAADETQQKDSDIDAAYADVGAKLDDLRAVTLRETKAMKVGFLPKASALLMAYGEVVNSLNN